MAPLPHCSTVMAALKSRSRRITQQQQVWGGWSEAASSSTRTFVGTYSVRCTLHDLNHFAMLSQDVGCTIAESGVVVFP